MDAAGQLPEGAPTVEVAEALLLGGGVSRPPACRSSFGIEIGFIDNVDMVKTNEKEEAVAASAAPAGVTSSHSADETVGESCPQAGNRGCAQQPVDKTESALLQEQSHLLKEFENTVVRAYKAELVLKKLQESAEQIALDLAAKEAEVAAYRSGLCTAGNTPGEGGQDAPSGAG